MSPSVQSVSSRGGRRSTRVDPIRFASAEARSLRRPQHHRSQAGRADLARPLDGSPLSAPRPHAVGGALRIRRAGPRLRPMQGARRAHRDGSQSPLCEAPSRRPRNALPPRRDVAPPFRRPYSVALTPLDYTRENKTSGLTDKEGAVSPTSISFRVSVANVPPTATFVVPAPVYEGSSFTLSLTNPSDVPADVCGGTPERLRLRSHDPRRRPRLHCMEYFFVDCLRPFSGQHVASGRSEDHGQGRQVTTYTGVVNVLNANPVATSISPTIGATYKVGQPVPVAVGFTDPGRNDTHTATDGLGNTTTVYVNFAVQASASGLMNAIGDGVSSGKIAGQMQHHSTRSSRPRWRRSPRGTTRWRRACCSRSSARCPHRPERRSTQVTPRC
jgi:hypothetical protein